MPTSEYVRGHGRQLGGPSYGKTECGIWEQLWQDKKYGDFREGL